MNTEAPENSGPIPTTREYEPCPCGKTPTEILINLPRGSKYGQAQGNCCGDWALEFKAGFPKTNEELTTQAIDAWNNAPRGNT